MFNLSLKIILHILIKVLHTDHISTNPKTNNNTYQDILKPNNTIHRSVSLMNPISLVFQTPKIKVYHFIINLYIMNVILIVCVIIIICYEFL